MRGREHRGIPVCLWVVLIAFACSMAAFTMPSRSSFASKQNLSVLEFTLTQVFGSDDWSIREASLSPDGRWIAFSREDGATRRNIWIVSREGGEPIPLTTGSYLEDTPIWFPSAGRIAFRSTRTPIPSIMTIPLDPLTGRPTGPARQVTLDSILAGFDVSPDGRWIVFTALPSLLRILPATGGTARTVAEGTLDAVWSPDGNSIYYVTESESAPLRTLMRVSVDNSHAEEIFTWAGRIKLMSRGANRNFVLRECANSLEWEIANLAGYPIGRIVFPRGMNPVGISREGDRILCVKPTWTFPLMILPVEGGAARRLDVGHKNGDPLGWSPDGKRVLFETDLNDEAGLLYAPVAGGPMPQVKLSEERLTDFIPALSGDGNHILYAVGDEGDEISTLKVYSIEEDRSWELSRSHPFNLRGESGMVPKGSGGTIRRDGEDFLYYEKQDDRYLLYASPPRGPSRLLRSFSEKPPESIAVHGERIVWAENSESEAASLFLATAGEAGRRRIMIRQGWLGMPVWSRDGTKIAVCWFDSARFTGNPSDPAGIHLIVLEVSLSGEAVEKPESYSIPAGNWWSPCWHPDGRKILVVGMDGNVWLIPLQKGSRPVPITQDEPNGVWSFHLSPDGRNIAYPVSIQRGSSIWLLELEKPLTEGVTGVAPDQR